MQKKKQKKKWKNHTDSIWDSNRIIDYTFYTFYNVHD